MELDSGLPSLLPFQVQYHLYHLCHLCGMTSTASVQAVERLLSHVWRVVDSTWTSRVVLGMPVHMHPTLPKGPYPITIRLVGLRTTSPDFQGSQFESVTKMARQDPDKSCIAESTYILNN